MTTDEALAQRPQPPEARTTTAAPPEPAGAGDRPRPRPSRLPSLTGLRFLAALLVFFYHSSLPFPGIRLLRSDGAWSDYYRITSQAGALGVTFFFVLSGFVLTWSARRGDTARAFWRRRYVKIVPNYVLTWAAAMALYAAIATPAWRATANLFMLQSWIPDFATNFSVDPPSWSLGAEAVFYALFPVIFLGVSRIRADRLKYWLVGTLAAIVATPAVAYAFVVSSPQMPMPFLNGSVSTYQYWFAYVLPLPRVFDFVLGILVARLVMAGRWRNIGVGWSALLLIGCYIVALHSPHLYAQRVVCIVPIALLIAAAATADANGRFTPFRNRAMTWLGDISFAFYLVHYIVIATSRRLIGTHLFSTPVSIALIAGQIAVAVLVAGAVYTWFERPIVRRWSSPRTARPRT